jgi:hypothetical protein
VILYNDDLGEVVARDEAESTFSNVDTRRIKRNMSLHNTFATSECTLTPIESIDASCLWYNVVEGRYIKEPALGLRSHKRHSVTSTPPQVQPQTLPNPPSHCKIRPTSCVTMISLRARQLSLRSTPSPSLPTAVMMDGLMRAWLN